MNELPELWEPCDCEGGYVKGSDLMTGCPHWCVRVYGEKGTHQARPTEAGKKILNLLCYFGQVGVYRKPKG